MSLRNTWPLCPLRIATFAWIGVSTLARPVTCNDSTKFESTEKCNISVSTAKKGETLQAIGISDYKIAVFTANGDLVNLIVHDVLYAPDSRGAAESFEGQSTQAITSSLSASFRQFYQPTNLSFVLASITAVTTKLQLNIQFLFSLLAVFFISTPVLRQRSSPTIRSSATIGKITYIVWHGV